MPAARPAAREPDLRPAAAALGRRAGAPRVSAPNAKLTLASASPRRRELLTTLGLSFDVRPADVDESVLPGEAPSAYVRRMAETKLSAALAGAAGEAFVLASDTVVVLGGRILGKPVDDEEGVAMIRALAARTHEVRTAVALGRRGEALSLVEVLTSVVFRAIDEDEARRYVATGEGRDKAGGYAVQGRAGAFVTRLEGSYSNVVGLPLAETLEMLRAHGVVGAWP
ncbi:MAG: septum formation inhibitor Maf [Myxococcales bacterium]|nr:septum formation inhibitor Maf [Myxococcales bacterium]